MPETILLTIGLTWQNRYETRYSDSTPHDLQTLKHFMDYCVRGWNATQKIFRKTGQKKIAFGSQAKICGLSSSLATEARERKDSA
jgi:hypothetical protein